MCLLSVLLADLGGGQEARVAVAHGLGALVEAEIDPVRYAIGGLDRVVLEQRHLVQPIYIHIWIYWAEACEFIKKNKKQNKNRNKLVMFAPIFTRITSWALKSFEITMNQWTSVFHSWCWCSVITSNDAARWVILANFNVIKVMSNTIIPN